MKKTSILVAGLSSILVAGLTTSPAQAAPCNATDAKNIVSIVFEGAIAGNTGDLEPLFNLIDKVRKKAKSKKMKTLLNKLETTLEQEGSVQGPANKLIDQLYTMKEYKRC